MAGLKESCLKAESEYREWRECPHWYCVKTTVDSVSGYVECEIVADEKTGVPTYIQSNEKPLDGVYETAESTSYFTYCQGYKEAEQIVKATTKWQDDEMNELLAKLSKRFQSLNHPLLSVRRTFLSLKSYSHLMITPSNFDSL